MTTKMTISGSVMLKPIHAKKIIVDYTHLWVDVKNFINWTINSSMSDIWQISLLN